MKKLILIYVLFLSLCLPGVNNAEEAQKNTVKMKEVVVTSGRIEEKKEDIPTNITVLTEEDIARPSVNDLADLLEDQGFMIREYPNSLSSVNIRGFQTDTHGNDLCSHVLLLIDGRRAGSGNLSEIQMDNVERVEIIRGPGAVQYGSAAMGGVINIITKQGKDKVTAYAEGSLGSWNNKKASVGASGKTGNFDFSLSGTTESQDDYDTANGVTYHNTGFDSKDRISLSAGWALNTQNRLEATYSNYRGKDIGSPDYLSAVDIDNTVDHSIDRFDLAYTGKTSEDDLSWSIRYFLTDREYVNMDGNTLTYFQDTDQQGAQGQMSFGLGFITLTGGIDWVRYEIEDFYTTGDNVYDNPAAFLLTKSRFLNDRLIISAGLRFDKYDIDSDDERSVGDENWTPSIGAAFKINQLLSVRANYSEAFIMPTADQLFMFNDYSAFGFGIWAGNPGLSPEKSKTYEMGMDFSKGSISAGATFFRTDFEDKISYAYDAVADVTRYENIKGAKMSGIEGSFGMDIGEIYEWNWELKPYVSFTYLAEYEDKQNNIDLQYNPSWSASYGIRCSNPEIGFSSALNFAYIDDQDITDYEGTGATSLPDYTMVDLSFSKELLSFDQAGRFLLNGSISNLFNKDYAVIQGYPSPGRTFNIGLKYVW